MREQFLSKDTSSHEKALQRMKDVFHQNAFLDMDRDNSKLRTYKNIKTKIGYELYLSNIQCIKERTALTKLRLSNHLLMIEKGRHLNIDRESRFCPFCPNSVENEIHFITQCKPYQFLRRELFSKAETTIPHFSRLNENQKFEVLMSKTCTITAQFTRKAMDLREFLIAEHKMQD